MADDNNRLGGNVPSTPAPALKKLDRLVGTWRERGGYNGTSYYEWMEGGFFLIHRYDGITPAGRRVTGIEYVGFDEETRTLRSHLFDIHGSNFVYGWDLEGDGLTIWFGDRGSSNFYQGRLNAEGDTLTGRWQWPEGDRTGGFEAIARRVE